MSCGLFLLLCGTRGAADEARGFNLVWDADPACPEARVLSGVRRLLGADPAAVASPPLHGEARLTRTDRSWHLSLEVVRGEARSQRRLEVGSCEEAADAAALILALAIDPRVADRAPELRLEAAAAFDAPDDPATQRTNPVGPLPAQAPAFVPDEPVISVPPELPSAPRAGAPPLGSSRPRAVALANTSMAASFGALPQTSPGLALGAGIQYGHAAFEITGAAYAEREAQEPAGSAGLVANLMTVDLRAAWRLRVAPRWELGPTATVELGRFTGRGIRVGDERSPTVPWAAAGGGGSVALRLRRSWALVGAAEALIPWRRTHFQVNGATAHRPAPVVGSVRLGFELRFPHFP